MDTEHTAPAHPFKHIALSLSGGGMRAVGYHIGTLDYLNHTGLLSEVHTLSSVSGGSLVAIGYALSLKKGESFQEFHDNICEFLPELNTLEELLKILESRTPPVASGSRTLITAMAKVYQDKYFGRYYDDPTFGIFWEEEPDIPLKEIIFNATEFRSGIAFRFQKSQFNSLIGNGKIWIDEKYAKEIRMSDIMAASSCIPVGMEPLMFPQDFHWPGDPDGNSGRHGKGERPYCEEVEEYLRERFDISSVPLMDGGVYDNQGITSIILTVARNFRGKKSIDEDSEYDEQAGLEPLRPHAWAQWLLHSMEQASDTEQQKDMGEVDLFIVSDTPIRREPMYAADPVSHSRKKGFKGWLRQLRLGTINKIVWAITIILLISIFAIANRPVTDSLFFTIFYRFEMLFLFLLVIGTVGTLLFIRYKGDHLAEMVVEAMPPMKRTLWSYAKTLRLGQIWDMASLRATSMSALTSRIFMNRIRQLGYSLLYSHEEFRKRIMDNNINDIKSLTTWHSDDVPDFVQSPSDEVVFVVERAAGMATRLWIEKPERERHDLDVLIAAGHVSTCFNVIEYVWQFHRDENGQLNENVRALFEQAKSDWLRLNEDPYWLVDQRKNVGREPGSLFWRSDVYARKRWSLRSRKKQAT